MAGNQPFTWVAWVKISVCFTYRIYPFETFEYFCSCIRGHWVGNRPQHTYRSSSISACRCLRRKLSEKTGGARHSLLSELKATMADEVLMVCEPICIPSLCPAPSDPWPMLHCWEMCAMDTIAHFFYLSRLHVSTVIIYRAYMLRSEASSLCHAVGSTNSRGDKPLTSNKDVIAKCTSDDSELRYGVPGTNSVDGRIEGICHSHFSWVSCIICPRVGVPWPSSATIWMNISR